MIDRFYRAALAGFLAGLFVGALDTALLLTAARYMFFNSREIAKTVVWSLAMASGAGIALGALFALLGEGARNTAGRAQQRISIPPLL